MKLKRIRSRGGRNRGRDSLIKISYMRIRPARKKRRKRRLIEEMDSEISRIRSSIGCKTIMLKNKMMKMIIKINTSSKLGTRYNTQPTD